MDVETEQQNIRPVIQTWTYKFLLVDPENLRRPSAI
jgi:hypothetical protein